LFTRKLRHPKTATGVRHDPSPPAEAPNKRVFPDIKPLTNSFVWSAKGGDLAIFLYVEYQTTARFENTVAHECHHIGLQSLFEAAGRSSGDIARERGEGHELDGWLW
jgi:hypothetical protein